MQQDEYVSTDIRRLQVKQLKRLHQAALLRSKYGSKALLQVLHIFIHIILSQLYDGHYAAWLFLVFLRLECILSPMLRQ